MPESAKSDPATAPPSADETPRKARSPAKEGGPFALLESALARPAPKVSIAALVRVQVDALDGFMAEVGLGVRNQRHVDDLDDRLGRIIEQLSLARRAGRYPVAARA